MGFNQGLFPTQNWNQPFWKPFFFRIRHLDYKQDPQPRLPERGPDFYWAPPESKDRFTLLNETPWYTWSSNQPPHNPNTQSLRLTTAEEDGYRRHYRSCTMFWCPDRHGYLIVPVDCLETELRSNAILWRRLSFSRTREAETPHIALAGYHMERYHLHIPGPESWFEQLLPDVCEPPIIAPRNCALAGELSILIGLVAFSAEPASAIWAVNQSFRPNSLSTVFQPNRLPKAPRNLYRGMVVEIGYDPRVVTDTVLRHWEYGKCGEIFS